MTYAVGSLVRARGREWVVLPESVDDFLVVRPLGGTDDEIAGLAPALEPVAPATFDLPDPEHPGDHRSCRLLRDAVRLGFRSSAGPFRSFARLNVDPRPYQLVPLLMALRLDPVRILIADDVGIGKTVEAGLIARELLDRGEVERLAVLCPPHLTEQWQKELRTKFHIDAERVLPSTVTRLERGRGMGESLFDIHPFVIVSTDFIKSDRRRDDFLRACPELVIVDEAHTCASGYAGRGSRHQRHQLVRGLAAKADRHVILVTATPHSGKEDAFRSLLAHLNPDFASLPDDLSGDANEPIRRKLSQYFVQRRRADIRAYLGTETDFPEREEAEEQYRLHPDYAKLFEKVLSYAQEIVQDDAGGNKRRQRVRWWSALALLRALASSPAAAAATLRNRAASTDTETVEEADEVGRRSVLDLTDDEPSEGADISPGADAVEDEAEDARERRRLREMAREADALIGVKDEKLRRAAQLIKKLVADGHQPIVFCRFIDTAEYVAKELRSHLPKGVAIEAVTGTLPPEEREARVAALGEAEKRVLVATDCLSEGINLQEHFDAVFHYDLSWNPTRHEQREGRVDRYMQPRKTVRVVTYYGTDNHIDGVVLRVLLRKHKTIRSSLGISVPVPVDTDQVIEAIFESLLLRPKKGSTQQQTLAGFDEYFRKEETELFLKWDKASEREKQSQTFFAQRAIKVEEVAAELAEIRRALGSGAEVERFVRDAVALHGGLVSGVDPVRIDLRETPRALREAAGDEGKPIVARFDRPAGDGQLALSRTHPLVEGLATYILDRALDTGGEEARARRCGVLRTGGVSKRTTVLLCRARFHILTRQKGKETPLLAEDCFLLGFTGAPERAEWLAPETAEALLSLGPDGNVLPDLARNSLRQILSGMALLRPRVEEAAREKATALLDAHTRVRQALKVKGISHRVEPQLPVDVLGVYVFLPKA